MSGSSLSTKLQVALVAQAIFALVLIFYISQTLLRHLQFGVPQPIVDYFVQLLAIIVPPAMLLLSVLALRSPRRAIQASVIAQLLVCLAAARFLLPELLRVARGEGRRLVGTPLYRRFCSRCARLPHSCGRLLLPPCCHLSEPPRLTNDTARAPVRDRFDVDLVGQALRLPAADEILQSAAEDSGRYVLRHAAAAILVFLPAAAGTRFVAANLGHGTTNR
jgi:hypothetical protein